MRARHRLLAVATILSSVACNAESGLEDITSPRITLKKSQTLPNYEGPRRPTPDTIKPSIPFFTAQGELQFGDSELPRAEFAVCDGTAVERTITAHLEPRLELAQCQVSKEAYLTRLDAYGLPVWRVGLGQSDILDMHVDGAPDLVSVVRGTAPQGSGVQVVDVVSGDKVASRQVDVNVVSVVMSPNREFIYWQANQSGQLMRTREATGEIEAIAEIPRSTQVDITHRVHRLAISGDGTLLAAVIEAQDRSAYAAFMIFDIEKREWLLRKQIFRGLVDGNSLVRTGARQFGVLYLQSSTQTPTLDHYCVDKCE